MIEEARRAADAKVSPVNSLLCMRERAQKRGLENDGKPLYLCCDISLLHDAIQRHMWQLTKTPSPSEQRASITLLVAGWALCGCDFVPAVNPLRSDAVFESIGEIVRTRPETLKCVEAAWAGDRAALQQIHRPLRELLTVCCSRMADFPRIKKDKLLSLRNVDESVLGRASWVAAYWNSIEMSGNLEEFGFFHTT